jgi:hypothetical protein
VFGATMSCNRFQFLLSHLRFDDITIRTEAREHDKFCAARVVLELFNDACTAALQCGESICVDECLYPTRGRGFAGRQYLKDKPRKYGMLYRSLNDSKHAYTYRTHIYAGRPAGTPTENYIQGGVCSTSLRSVYLQCDISTNPRIFSSRSCLFSSRS